MKEGATIEDDREQIDATGPAELAKTNNAPMNVRRCPKRVISHALSSMPTVIPASAPVAGHCARSWPMPMAPMMSGMATLADVVVSTAEIVPSITVTVANQR